MNALKQWKEASPIKLMRSNKDVTQGDLAGLIGVSPKTVQVWEYGASTPTPERLDMIAEALGVSKKLLKKEYNKWILNRPHK